MRPGTEMFLNADGRLTETGKVVSYTPFTVALPVLRVTQVRRSAAACRQLNDDADGESSRARAVDSVEQAAEATRSRLLSWLERAQANTAAEVHHYLDSLPPSGSCRRRQLQAASPPRHNHQQQRQRQQRQDKRQQQQLEVTLTHCQSSTVRHHTQMEWNTDQP